MSDLIDRQAALDAFQMFRKYDSNRSNSEWVNRIEVVLKNQPTIDAVEVVRCKDCKWKHGIHCEWRTNFISSDDFCSDAERRTDGTD